MRNHVVSRALGIAVLAVLLGGCSGGGPPGQTPLYGPCPGGAIFAYPRWVPGGDFITYNMIYPDNLTEIALLRIDGTSLTPLTDGTTDDRAAAWSPDPGGTGSSKQIAFVSTRDGNLEIYVMDIALLIKPGTAPINKATGLVRLTDNPASDMAPAWSPDGRHIAFSSDRDGDREIYLMDADGRNPTRLTDSPGADDWPAWSPDGKQIAFMSRRDGYPALYVMDADPRGPASSGPAGSGANPKRLIDDLELTSGPDWSPDGKSIAFSAGENGISQIFTVNTDGSGLTRLTGSAGGNTDPDWSPDGRQITFVSTRNGSDAEVFMINADPAAPGSGSHERQETFSAGNRMCFNWPF